MSNVVVDTKTESDIVRMLRKNKKMADKLLAYLEIEPQGGGVMKPFFSIHYADTVSARINRLKQLLNDKG